MIITVYELVFALYVFTMLLPSFLSHPIINVFENLFAVFAVLTLVKRKYKPSSFVCAFWGYIIVLILSSVINNTSAVDIHLFISNLKLIVLMALLEWFSLHNKESALKVLWRIVSTISIINLISIIAFPTGIRQIIYVWNEWGATSEVRQWVVGNKNSQALWYITFLLLAYYYLNEKFQVGSITKKVLAVCASFVSFYAVYAVNSSTGMAAVAVIMMSFLISTFCKKTPALRFNAKWLLVFYAILLVLLLLGNTSFLSPIVSGIFGKDLTFSNRTYVWTNSLLLFLKRPILGWGFLSNDGMRELLGSLSYTTAHNQVLNTLLQGGIIIFGFLIFGFLILTSEINKAKTEYRLICFFALCSVMIEMLFEAVLGEPIAWTMLFVIHIMCTNRKKGESEGIKVGWRK